MNERMSEDQKYEKQIKESNVRLVKALRETVSLGLQAAVAKERDKETRGAPPSA